jgi:ADP-heptose:LPS heptosyltransferase
LIPRLGIELRRIAVVRALPGLGDLLCAVPALRALRGSSPDAHIALIGLPAVAPIVARFGCYVDELLPFPGFPGIPEVPPNAPRIVEFLAASQRRGFDLALQLHGNGQATNAFVALLGARRTAGFLPPGIAAGDAELFLPYPEDRPEPLRHLSLMRFLGIEAEDPSLEFPVRERDQAELERLADPHRLEPGRYACIHPGAAEAQRRWPPERFADVADALAERELLPVLTGGPGERAITAATAASMTAPAVDLGGSTSVGGLALLLASAAVTVTNDTGTSHLAAAMRAPSVVIFSASDAVRWAPLDRALHRPLTDATSAAVVAECDSLLAAAVTP